MRGKDDFFRPMQVGQGITPACAGKRPPVLAHRERSGDHPRVCGEKQLTSYRPEDIDRITPACAGKSERIRFLRKSLGDHPRVCGEKYPDGDCGRSTVGSPPRVRGKGNRYL